MGSKKREIEMNGKMSRIWVQFRCSYFPSEPWGDPGVYLGEYEMGPKSGAVVR